MGRMKEELMAKAVFSVPKMYADHHVLAVHQALEALEGVDSIYASSAFKRVIVHYDPAKLSEEAIAEALREAGYGPGETWPVPMPREAKADDSPWFQAIRRVTWTNRGDLEMSGDFRKY